MKCPSCLGKLENVNYHGVILDRCISCDGLWFDGDELRKAKDRSDHFFKWIDIDLWKDDAKFRLRGGKERLCPKDGVPLYELEYGDSGVHIDFCSNCGGVWLDQGELRAILDHLHSKLDRMTLQEYLAALRKEGMELAGGAEGFGSEFQDFLVVQQLILYRVFYRLPFLARLISQLP